MICDYYVGIFRDFTTTNGDYFPNDYNLINSDYYYIKDDKIGGTPDSNGVPLVSSDELKLKGWNMEEWEAVSLQYWFKGTIGNDKFVYLEPEKDSPIYLERSGNNIIVKSEEASESVNIGDAFSGASSTEWMLIGASIGWLGDDDEDEYVM